MKQSLQASGAHGLLARAFRSYAAGLGRSLLSSDAIVYPAGGEAEPRDGRHDFDFLHGRWQVRNVRLKARLVGCTEWEAFDARTECRPILAHGGNLEEYATDWRGGYHGMAVRLYDPQRRQWSIHWANRDAGALEPPVVGRFEHGVGTFLGRDRCDGKPVSVRFFWHDIHADSAHWEQAFSLDDGRHWETNWHMHFSREAA